MLASNGTGTVPVRPRRRWTRSGTLRAAVVVLALLALGGYIYQRSSRPVLPPPDVDMEGADPSVAAAVERGRDKVRQEPHSADAWGKLGMVLLVHEFRSQAAYCFDRAEELGPREVRWPYYQALGAMLKSDLEAAKGKLERAVALSGDQLGGPRLVLAEVLLGLEELDEAQRHFLLLLDKNPEHTKAHLGLARVAIKRGDYRASLEPLSRAESDPCTRHAACDLLAEVREQLGDHAAAEAARRRAAELPADLNWPDPLRDELAALHTGKVAWLKQAEAYNREGRRTEALAVLQRTVRTYPSAEDAWLALGKTLYEQKMMGPAEEALRRACALAPTMHEPVNELGRVLIARDNRAEALTCFRKALELKPNAAQAWHNLGTCLFGAGDRSGALDAYAKAVHYAPEVFETQFALAVLLADRGRPAEALVHVEHAVRLKPNHPSARQLLEQLKKERPASRSGS